MEDGRVAGVTAVVDSLPSPDPDHLTLYVFGPGVGEAQLIALPTGEWLSVDACVEGKTDLPLAVLERFGVTRLRLAVLTHPDADHCKGFGRMLKRVDADHVWCYPALENRRTLIASIARRNEADPRWADLSVALDEVSQRMAENRAESIVNVPRAWRVAKDCEAVAVAPSPADLQHEGAALHQLMLRAMEGDPLLDESGFLLEGRAPVGQGNGISIAVALQWREARLLLGGDVEHHTSPHRGWRGALALVEAEDGFRGRLDDMHVVKVAHHGSNGAYSDGLWDRHAKSTRPTVVVTPFRGGQNPPPHRRALSQISRLASTLSITAEPALGWAGVVEAGWRHIAEGATDGVCCSVVRLRGDGTCRTELYGAARAFETAAMVKAP